MTERRGSQNKGKRRQGREVEERMLAGVQKNWEGTEKSLIKWTTHTFTLPF